MAVVNFVPDPTQPYGSGTFTSDTGRTWYAQDADLARSIVTPDSGAANSDMQGGGAPIASTPPDAAISSQPEALVSKAAQVTQPATATQPPAPEVAPPSGAGGSSPVSPQILAAKAANVVKMTNSTSFGRKAANVQRDVAALDTAEAGTEGAIKQKAVGDEQRQNASIGSQLGYQTQVQEDEQQRAQDAANRKAALQTKLNQISAQSDATVDPDRFVSNLGTGGQIGMAVLAMVSGFAQGGGAALSHTATPTDNPVVGILQRRIAADIESQKTQIESGRIRRGNVLASLREQLGDEKSAELMATSLMNQAAANKAQLVAQKLNLQGAALDNANVAIAGIQQTATAARNAAMATGENHYAASSEHEIKPAAGANGEAQTKAWENYTKAVDAGQDQTKAYQQSGLAALGITQPMGQNKEQRTEATKAGERSEGQAKASAVGTAAQPYAAALELVRDPLTGKYSAPPGREGDSPADTIGNRMVVGATGNQSAREAFQKQHSAIKTARLSAAQAIVAATGGGMKLGEAEDLIDGDTLGEIANNLNAQLANTKELRSPTERNAPTSNVSSLGFKPVAK
jgi:hypothetical protein